MDTVLIIDSGGPCLIIPICQKKSGEFNNVGKTAARSFPPVWEAEADQASHHYTLTTGNH